LYCISIGYIQSLTLRKNYDNHLIVWVIFF
jgi:hypothetical protein